jgi:hypothetical protein
MSARRRGQAGVSRAAQGVLAPNATRQGRSILLFVFFEFEFPEGRYVTKQNQNQEKISAAPFFVR